jgi:peptide/nickel transport system substrate-binding protein
MAAALWACESAPPPVAAGGELVIGAVAEPDLLLPPLAVTGPGLQVVDQLFERLVAPRWGRDGRLTWVPALATAWRWAPDSLTLDFTLDARARWHDGRPVRATDVVFTWRAYVDSTLGAPGAVALRQIDSVQAMDAGTVRFHFGARRPGQLALAGGEMHILPAHALDSIPRARWRTSGFARAPIGSGPFRFGRWAAGARLELVADRTSARAQPVFDRVTWTLVADPGAASLRLFAGDVHFLESVRPDQVAAFAGQAGVRLLRSPSLVYGFLQFNLEPGRPGRPALFADAAVRRALAMAVDRPQLVAAVFDTLARPALGPVTRIQLGGDTLLPVPRFDPAAAEAMLDSLGWRRPSAADPRARGGIPLRFTILVPSSSAQRLRVAELLQQRFRRIGVEAAIEPVEFNAFTARLAAGDFDAAVMALSADPDPTAVRGVWGSAASRAQGGVNFGNYRSPRFDALLDSAAAAPGAAESRRFQLAAYAALLEDAPAIWLYEPWAVSGIAADLRPEGIVPDGWWRQLAAWRREGAPPR